MKEKPSRTRKQQVMRLPNGHGSVHKIDGKKRRNPWRARVPSGMVVDYDAGTVKQQYLTIGYYPTRSEALDALYAYRQDPYTVEAAKCTFSNVFEMWRNERFPKISHATQNSYNTAYAASKTLHDKVMREITARDLERVMADMSTGASSQKLVKTLWIQLYKYAIKHDLCKTNYAELITTKDKDAGTTRRALTSEEISKIWEAANAGHQTAKLALIYVYTGFRATELLDIQKDAVDLETRIIIGGKKTAAGIDRHVPIHRAILPFLSEYMVTPCDYLISFNGKKATYKVLTTKWKALFSELGLDAEITPHYARHTCATMLREAKIPDDIVKLILGHSSNDITDRYTHRSDASLVEAIDMVPSRIV